MVGDIFESVNVQRDVMNSGLYNVRGQTEDHTILIFLLVLFVSNLSRSTSSLMKSLPKGLSMYWLSVKNSSNEVPASGRLKLSKRQNPGFYFRL